MRKQGAGHNPTRCNPPTTNCGETTWGITTFTYDSLGRTKQVQHPDGTVAQTTYTGAATETTDEGNGTKSVQRISQVDGLGRLISVCEVSSATLIGISPTPAACGQDIGGTVGKGFLTTYSYDGLDDLISVAQGGLNPRTFQYDSLSRLTSATNPESGTITYSYDPNGNVATRTAPKPNQTNASVTVTTTYAYDALNRLLTKSYNDGITPTATFVYDTCTTNCPAGATIQNATGRLVEAITPSDNNYFAYSDYAVNSYDPMGRIAEQWQCHPNSCGGGLWSGYFVTPYTYDLLGNMLSSTSDSINYTYTYNMAGQLTTVNATRNGQNDPGNLFSAPTYNPAGLLSRVTLANGILETRSYDNRLRLSSSADGTVYTFSPGYAPNGDVLTANDSVNGNWVYTYDDFNRLITASQNSGQNKYSYVYDRFGNRWQQNLTAGTGQQSSLTFDANNHISGSGITYDAAGNVIANATASYAHDAENRIYWTNATYGEYGYDAFGRRVSKGQEDYVLDFDGHPITDNGGGWNGTDAFAAGRHLAIYESGTVYTVHADWLGSERARTTTAGAIYQTCTGLPFGEESCTPGFQDPTFYFTGQWHDPESGLDYFGARHYASTLGRFMSPDPSVSGDPDTAGEPDPDPQSWNAYSYARNSPIDTLDPDGLDCVFVLGNTVWVHAGDCTGISNGTYVPGTINEKSGTYDPRTGTVGFSYTPYSGGIGFGFISGVYPSRGVSDADRLNAAAQGTQMAAPGVNLAYNGLKLFGNIVSFGAMTAAECVAGGPDCTASNIGLAAIPGLGALSEELSLSINNLKHILHHVPEFAALDKSLGLKQVVAIGQDVVRTGTQVGPKAWVKTIQIGQETVTVKAVLNNNGALRTVYLPGK